MSQGQVGYQLINIADNSVIESWGGHWGETPSIPGVLVLPNGDQVCAPEINVVYSGYKLIPWLMDEPVPSLLDISDRQFYQQANVAGYITQDEALAAVQTGTIPSMLQMIINSMPADQQFNAKMLLSGATIFQRGHPLTGSIGTALGLSSEQLDDFFRAAYLL